MLSNLKDTHSSFKEEENIEDLGLYLRASNMRGALDQILLHFRTLTKHSDQTEIALEDMRKAVLQALDDNELTAEDIQG